MLIDAWDDVVLAAIINRISASSENVARKNC
jgi:hypothetical protein